MVCKHLIELEESLLDAGMSVSYRGQAWAKNCREWVYFDCVLDISRVRAKFEFAACIEDHEHKGTHDGSELGLVCRECLDAVLGLHPDGQIDAVVFPNK